MNENSFLFAYIATTTLCDSRRNKLAFSRNDPQSTHDFTHCFRTLLVNARIQASHLFITALRLLFPRSSTSSTKYVNAIWQRHSVIHKWYRKYFSLVYIHIYSHIFRYCFIQANWNEFKSTSNITWNYLGNYCLKYSNYEKWIVQLYTHINNSYNIVYLYFSSLRLLNYIISKQLCDNYLRKYKLSMKIFILHTHIFVIDTRYKYFFIFIYMCFDYCIRDINS